MENNPPQMLGQMLEYQYSATLKEYVYCGL